jgi:hypothetical protein
MHIASPPTYMLGCPRKSSDQRREQSSRSKYMKHKDEGRRRKQEYHISSSNLRMREKVNIDQVVPSFRVTTILVSY